MRPPGTHVRLLVLLCLLLVVIPLLLAGGSVLFSSPSDEANAEAFDRIVPGLTRAEDVPGIGIALNDSATLSGAQMARRFSAAKGSVRACLEAGVYCSGYVLRLPFGGGFFAPPKPAQMILLVMNGRIVHKVLSRDGAPMAGTNAARPTIF